MKKFNILALLCGLFYTAIYADDIDTEQAAYIGVGVGYTTQKFDFSTGNIPTNRKTSYNSGKPGAKVYAGYTLSENFGFEFGYNYLNKATSNITNSTTKETASLDGHIFSLAAVVSMPLDESWSIFGKVGPAIYRNTLNSQEKAAIALTGNNQSNQKAMTYAMVSDTAKTKITSVVAIGGEYKLDKNIALRAEYEYLGQPKLDKAKVKYLDMFSFGLRYSF